MWETLRKFRQFLIDVWKELKRTSWPSKKEVYGTTLVVVVTVITVAIYLGAVDSLAGDRPALPLLR